MKLRSTATVLALLTSTLLWGQGLASSQKDNSPKLPKVRTAQKRYKASNIDSRKFFPQVSVQYVFHPVGAENPAELPDFPGIANRLPVGQITDIFRASPGAAFPGMDRTGWRPADPDIAVGQNHILQVVNQELAWYTKSGTKQFQQTAQSFFAGMGAFNFQFDPKCFYDRVHDRYVLVFLERDGAAVVSKILVAVSDDGDPNGTWHRYRIEAKLRIGASDYWMDYPGFGYNKDAYIVNGNMFRFGGGFAGVQFIIMESAGMVSGGTAVVTHLRDANSGSAQMAEVIDPNKDAVFAIARRGTSSARIYAFTNLTSNPSGTFVDVAVPTNSSPNGDAQSTNGRFLDTIDGRIFNAVWRNGSLVAGHTIEATSFRGSRWYEFNTGNWPASGTVTLVQSGNIESPTHNHFFPAVNINSTGRISALLTRSSTTTTADMVVTGRLPWDALGTMGAPVLLEPSAGNDYSGNRWGDYFGVDVDPVDDVTFWGTAMTVAAGNFWTTQIRSWTIMGTSQHSSETFNWFRGTFQSGNLGSLLADDDDYNVARAGITLSSIEPPAQMVVETTAPSTVLGGIKVTIVSKANTVGLTQRIQLWNITTSQWDSVGVQATSSSETTQIVTVTSNVGQYVDPATKKVKVKFNWFQTGIALLFPWTVSVDMVRFDITSA